MKIHDLKIDGRPYLRPVQVLTVAPVASAAELAKGAVQGEGLQAALQGITGGVVAKYAWNGFQASHTLTQDQVVAGLIGNGVAPAQAPAIASTALDIMRAEPTKVLLVAVSAGGGAWALLEAGGKLFGWKLRRGHKIAYTALAVLLAVAAYLTARALGIMA
jgi:hypothetical protein